MQVRNAFGGDLIDNMDKMLRLANRSPASFEQFGESIQYSGTLARHAGMDLDSYLAIPGWHGQRWPGR